MEQTVYGDLLFFVNFCMDFQCLFLTARLLHRPFPVRRSVLASVFGALYACAALFLAVDGMLALFLDLAVCFLMCALVFAGKRQGLRGILIPFALYFGVSFAVGGVMSGMATLLSHISFLPQEGGEDGSTLMFFLLALLGGGGTFLWGRLCQRRAKGKRVRLSLALCGKVLCVTGLLDTANLLTDPVGGRPVAILSREEGVRWLPPPLAALVERGSVDLTTLPPELAHRVRLVPAQSVTGHALLLCVLPERAVLDGGRGERAVELLVACTPLSVPSDCKALVPASLLTE